MGARRPENEKQTRFRNAAAKHEVQLFDLLATRAIDPRKRRGRISSASLNVGVDYVVHVLESSFPGGTVLLLFELDDSALKVWAVNSDIFEEETTAIGRIDLSQHTRCLRLALGVDKMTRSRRPERRDAIFEDQEDEIVNQDATLESVIRTLSDLLLPAPIAELIQSPTIDHVVIVPVGELGTIPFTLLTVGGLSLVDHVSITIAPSLGDLFQKDEIGHRNQPIDVSQALILGNPTYADPEWNLPNLPGAEREARAVAAKFGVEPLINEKATKCNVLGNMDADIIYLATHAVASKSNPLDASFIALAPTPGDRESGRWTAREIQHEWIGARLVVLSACQTGLGGVHDAGVIGLARAFQLAGCGQVVISLWSVDDLSTADFMEQFAGYICDGFDAPEALRRSAINVRHKGTMPWQWGAFTIFG